jgi:hypothetical protein
VLLDELVGLLVNDRIAVAASSPVGLQLRREPLPIVCGKWVRWRPPSRLYDERRSENHGVRPGPGRRLQMPRCIGRAATA